MAEFRLHVAMLQRGLGMSAVKRQAYLTGAITLDERTGTRYSFRRKERVQHTELLVPEGAPGWAHDPHQLWNAVERAERRCDAQVGREFQVSLPCVLTPKQRHKLARSWAHDQLVLKHGLAVEISIHIDESDRNPHAHFQVTTRAIGPDGLDPMKARHLEDRSWLLEWRETWAKYVNAALEAAGHDVRVDHRSYEDQGLDIIPMIKEGYAARAMEARGLVSDRMELNRQIRAENSRRLERRVTLQKLRATELAATKPDGNEGDMAAAANTRAKPSAAIAETRTNQNNEPSRGGVLGKLAQGLLAVPRRVIESRVAEGIRSQVDAEIARADILKLAAAEPEALFLEVYRNALHVSDGSLEQRQAEANATAVRAYSLETRSLDIAHLVEFGTMTRAQYDAAITRLWSDPEVRQKLRDAEDERRQEMEQEEKRKQEREEAEKEKRSKLEEEADLFRQAEEAQRQWDAWQAKVPREPVRSRSHDGEGNSASHLESSEEVAVDSPAARIARERTKNGHTR